MREDYADPSVPDRSSPEKAQGQREKLQQNVIFPLVLHLL